MKTTLTRTLLPPFVLPGAVGCYFLFGLGSNSGLAFGAMVVLVIGCALLWRPGEPPILLYVFGFQWLQSALGIFDANLEGLTVSELAYQQDTPGNTELATALSLIGLLFLAIGMRIGAGPQRNFDGKLALDVVQRYPVSTWFKLAVAAWLIAATAQSVALFLPGLSQPLLALANLKWAFFLILTYATFSRPGQNKTPWLVFFGLEFLASLGGYFSTFKTVFLFTLIGVVASGVRIKLVQALALAVVGAIMVMLGVVWTAVKVEYRPYLSGGETAQIVTVGYVESLEKLVEITSNLTHDDLSDAADRLVSRIAYTGYFGAVLDYVPQIVPHENGALWLDAITRPFMPRLFFPEKAIIDESAQTNKYTGLGVSGMAEGTQISLGYMAESYVDFGEIGMTVPIFMLGLILGIIYQKLLRHPNSRGILGAALAAATLFSVSALEMGLAKLVGSLITVALVAWLSLTIVVPRFLPWLRG
jgi:hypothetical protein